MALLKVFKETALPGVPVADSIYYVTDADNRYVQMYVTSSAGVARRIPTNADVSAQITAAVSSSANNTVVADIAARNAQTELTTNRLTLVLNATGDVTVASGAATYVVSSVGPVVWTKISEAESLDVVLSWANIIGKPSSTPANIDLAVTNSHVHSNLTQLNLIGDSGGNITYNGTIVKTEWSTTAW